MVANQEGWSKKYDGWLKLENVLALQRSFSTGEIVGSELPGMCDSSLK
jgi:hypothetical protein